MSPGTVSGVMILSCCLGPPALLPFLFHWLSSLVGTFTKAWGCPFQASLSLLIKVFLLSPIVWQLTVLHPVAPFWDPADVIDLLGCQWPSAEDQL
jgi:hypothetical protein